MPDFETMYSMRMRTNCLFNGVKQVMNVLEQQDMESRNNVGLTQTIKETGVLHLVYSVAVQRYTEPGRW